MADTLNYGAVRLMAVMGRVPDDRVEAFNHPTLGPMMLFDRELRTELRALIAEVDRLRERQDAVRAASEASTEALGLVGDQLQRLALLGDVEMHVVGDGKGPERAWALTISPKWGDTVRVVRPTVVDLMRAAEAIVAATRDTLPIDVPRS